LVWTTGFEFVRRISAQPDYGREPEVIWELYLEFWFVRDLKFLQVSFVCCDRPFEAQEGTECTALHQGIQETLIAILVGGEAPAGV
jgi:hypothetical protein